MKEVVLEEEEEEDEENNDNSQHNIYLYKSIKTKQTFVQLYGFPTIDNKSRTK